MTSPRRGEIAGAKVESGMRTAFPVFAAGQPPETTPISPPSGPAQWLFYARAQQQSAYRILVASSPEHLQRNEGDLWDSGKVVSPEQNQIAYGSKPLAANQECFWKVQVWDKDDKASDWSKPARWGMGLLRASDWQAKWIGVNPQGASQPGLPLFRREFKVEKPLRRAVVHVCGLGHHELFLNGQKVGDHFLDPAWTVYEKSLFYSSHDITAQLQNGSNANWRTSRSHSLLRQASHPPHQHRRSISGWPKLGSHPSDLINYAHPITDLLAGLV